MKRVYVRVFPLLLFMLFQFTAFSQGSAPEGIFFNEVYGKVKVTGNIIYGGNYNHFSEQNEELTMDIYQPDVAIDYRRPLLIYCHGGGFVKGDKSSDFAVDFGNYFAKRGYVVASINYRLGEPDPFRINDKFEISYQSVQDAKSAIRFFKRFSDDFCLDTSAFFLTGTSAGGSLTLSVAYWDQAEANSVVDEETFGSINSGSGNEGYSNSINSIIICWGGTPDTSWMRNETIPNQIFHGTQDPVIPFTSGENADGIEQYGGLSIYDASIRNGIESYLHGFNGEGHGVSPGSKEFDTLVNEMNSFMYNHLPLGIGFVPCNLALDLGEPFTVFPNPSDGYLHLQNTTYNVYRPARFSLYNSGGQIIHDSEFSMEPKSESIYNFTWLSSGMYLVRITTSQETRVIKVLIN